MKTKLIFLLFLLLSLLTLTNSLLSNKPGKIHKKVEDEIINDDQIPQTAQQSASVVSEAAKKEKPPSLVIGQDENETGNESGNGNQGIFFDYEDEYDREDEDGQDSFHHDHMADFLTNLF